MKELDFYSVEGKKEALEYFNSIVKKKDKSELAKILYSMMEFIANHEAKFSEIKNIL